MKKFFAGFFTAFSLFVALIVYYHYEIQETLIFRSIPLHQKHMFCFRHPHQEVFLPTSESGRIHGLHFKQESPKGVVYFLHGNSRNLDFHGHRAEMFLDEGFDFFSIDYRGFGKSSRGFKEDWLLEDALIGYSYLKQHYPDEKIFVIGHSLGSAMATYVAANKEPNSLILEAPFYNMIAAAAFTKPFLPEWLVQVICKYPLRSDIWMRDVACPVHIFHGTTDKIVPYTQGKKLYSIVPKETPSAFYTLDGWGHEELHEHEIYQANIWNILDSKADNQIEAKASAQF